MQRLIFACSLLACLLATGQVLGQAAEPPAAAPTDEAAYEAAISDAVAEFSAGHWEEARSLFTEAHRINPNARTLRGLGMTAFELRNYVEALQMLQRALASEVNPLTPSQREKTEDLLERTRAFVGVFTIEAKEGTTIQVDGLAAPYDSGGRLLLNTGKRRITIQFPDGPEGLRMVDVRGGEDGTLVFEPSVDGPTPAPAPVPVPVATEPVGQTAEVTVQEDTSGSATLPIVLTAVGGGLIVGGVITGLLAKGAQSDLEDECGEMPDMCPIEFQGKRDSATSLATVTNVLWVGGAVMAALGVTLFIIESGDGDEPAVQANISPAPGGAGMQVWGRF